MADKTKAELQKEADKLNAPLEGDETKAELEQIIESAEQGNLPNVYEARYDPANPPPRTQRQAPDPENGPDAAAGVGGMPAGGTGTGGTAGTTTGGGTTR